MSHLCRNLYIRLYLIRGLIILTAGMFAQTINAEEFDINRFSDVGAGWFKTFYVEETIPLKDALEAGQVKEDTAILVTETASGNLALITDQMAFHHLAQGTANGKDWMATF
jgi:hypothetical protein